MQRLRKAMKKIESQLDINTYYPGYIHKPIFYVGFVLICLGFLYVAYLNDFDFSIHGYVRCEGDFNCQNPLYLCNHQKEFTTPNTSSNPEFMHYNLSFQPYLLGGCERYKDIRCVDGICGKEWLGPGEVVGVEPDDSGFYYGVYVFAIIIK